MPHAKTAFALWLAAFTPWASSAPAPAPTELARRQEIVTQLPSGPPGASGALTGPTSLLGYIPAEATASVAAPHIDFTLAPGQSEDPDLGLFIDLTKADNPQPIRGGTKAPIDAGPRNMVYEKINSDLYAPPGTDKGDVPNAVWPLGLSTNRHGLNSSGWARQQNTNELPVASAMAGVDMHLEPYAYRELHWHKQDEWAYIFTGSCRVALVDEAGRSFVDDLVAGDVWFFPSGVPHSIQAKDVGVEFLLVFDDGAFSEDGTFLVSELFERNPKSVLAKNFRTDVSAFDNLPDGELYIFPGTPVPSNISEQNVTGPAGARTGEESFTYHLSQQAPYEVPGGSVKIIDPLTFPIASNFSAALFTVEPGAMREMHWHTKSDEWTYIISGAGRLTVYSAPEASRTFDLHTGDVGYIPVPDAHYLENTGSEPLVYLEILLAGAYNDISVGQWLGLTPQQVVKDHLKLPQSVINDLPKVKPFIVPGHKDLLNTDYSGDPL